MLEVVSYIVPIAVMLAICLGLAGPLTWVERRQSAMVQDRVGPNRAALNLFGKELRVFGLLHPFADVIKLITKEDTINAKADRFLYNIAPFIALFPALVTFAVVPFGPDLVIAGQKFQLQVARVEIGVLYIFAMSSLAVFGVTLAGYASASKLAMLGGLRASAQMISYEVTMGLAIMGVVLTFGSLEPSAIVLGQGEYFANGWLPKWGILVQPLGFILFFTAAIAENKRIPFDLAEGESEIVGYFVEYSGMKFGMFFMAEYIEVIVVSAVVVTLFLGGWQVPYLMDTGFVFPWGLSSPMPEWLVAGLRIFAFLGKLVFMCWFSLMIRWTLPRFRYDQVMTLGWRKMLPLSLINTVVTAAVVLALQ
ncbi:NADH-quinone oxidoreductase subunit H [Myxococcota bacterium]|nr:NADH-quinone oxidoreductase subunit H [Myxococcota bacterium]